MSERLKWRLIDPPKTRGVVELRAPTETHAAKIIAATTTTYHQHCDTDYKKHHQQELANFLHRLVIQIGLDTDNVFQGYLLDLDIASHPTVQGFGGHPNCGHNDDCAIAQVNPDFFIAGNVARQY